MYKRSLHLGQSYTYEFGGEHAYQPISSFINNKHAY